MVTTLDVEEHGFLMPHVNINSTHAESKSIGKHDNSVTFSFFK